MGWSMWRRIELRMEKGLVLFSLLLLLPCTGTFSSLPYRQFFIREPDNQTAIQGEQVYYSGRRLYQYNEDNISIILMISIKLILNYKCTCKHREAFFNFSFCFHVIYVSILFKSMVEIKNLIWKSSSLVWQVRQPLYR